MDRFDRMRFAVIAISLSPFFIAGILTGASSSCSPAMKQAEQKVLNAADVVCALDALDPGLLPTEIDAAIQAACGASPDVHRILEAHQRVAARAQARLALAPASSASAPPHASAPAVIPLAPVAASATPVCSSAASAPPSASAPPRKKKVSP